jgi:hypothetical protein
MNGSAPRSRLVAWRGTQIASKLITANLNCSETGNEDFMKSTRIQPDLTKCGGLSEGLRMGWMASDHCVLSSRTAGTPRSVWQPTWPSPPSAPIC